MDHNPAAPAMSLPPTVQDALVRSMAAAIVAVHQAGGMFPTTKEADDDDRDIES
jgi:hypothetical protein